MAQRVEILENAYAREPYRTDPRRVLERHPVWLEGGGANVGASVVSGAPWCRQVKALGLARLVAIQYRIDVINWASGVTLPAWFRPEWVVTAPLDEWVRTASTELEALGGAWPAGHTFHKRWWSAAAQAVFKQSGQLPVLYGARMGLITDIRNEGFRSWALERCLAHLEDCQADALLLTIKTSTMGKKWPREAPRFQSWTPYTREEWDAAWLDFVRQLHAERVRVITIEQQPDDHDWAWADDPTKALLLGEFQGVQ